MNEGDPINIPYKPADNTSNFSLTNIPNGLVDTGSTLLGNLPLINDDNNVVYIITVNVANNFGSDSGTITINVIADANLQGTPFNKYYEGSDINSSLNLTQSMWHTGVSRQQIEAQNIITKNATGFTSLTGSPFAIGTVFRTSTGNAIFFKNTYAIPNQGFYGLQISSQLNSGNPKLIIDFDGEINGVINTYKAEYENAFTLNEWHGLFIQYLGHNKVPSATAVEFEECFQVSIINTLTGVFTKLSNGTHTSSGSDKIGGYFPGGLNSSQDMLALSNFGVTHEGQPYKIDLASFCQTTLKNNDTIMSETEAREFVLDPKEWLDNFKIGQTFRYISSTYTSNFSYGLLEAVIATQVYLCGDDPNDIFPYFRNIVRGNSFPFSSTLGEAEIVNSTVNSINNGLIPGLTFESENTPTLSVNYPNFPQSLVNGNYNIFVGFSGSITGTPGTNTMTLVSDANIGYKYNIYTNESNTGVIAYNANISGWMIMYAPSGLGSIITDGSTFSVSTQAYDIPTYNSIIIAQKQSPSEFQWPSAEYI